MAELTKCVECAGAVSSEARACPHCNKYPRFYRCPICTKQNLKISEGIRAEYYSVFDSFHSDSVENFRLLHQDCCESILDQRLRCPICHNHIMYREFARLDPPVHEVGNFLCYKEISSSHKTICPKCGHRLEIGSCNLCALPLAHPESIEMEVGGLIKVRVHKTCFPILQDLFKSQKLPSSKNSKQTACFIATAAYGEDSLEVLTLRTFRDEHLLLKSVGHTFIAIYQRLSPPAAAIIEKHLFLRTLTRWLIVNPAYYIAKRYVKIQ